MLIYKIGMGFATVLLAICFLGFGILFDSLDRKALSPLCIAAIRG